jgi:polyhydroxyalkanoate synthase
VQIREEVEQVSLLGYCFGGLLTTLYTALHPETAKNLVTFTLPLDMSVQDLTMNTLMAKINPETLNLLTSVYGNCPAWFFKMGFDSQAPVHHLLDKYVGRYRNKDREGYEEMFTLFERWLNSDVPMAGQIFREFIQDLSHNNALMHDRFQIAGRAVKLQNITCPVLNVIGEHDDIVHPKSSLPLVDLVGGGDARNLLFPTGHIGAAVSAAAHKKLWPRVGAWFTELDGQGAH